MDYLWAPCIGGVVLLSAFIGAIFVWRGEKRIWNNGFAPDGSTWVLFDRDSQGGRGYRSASGGYYCWISYPGVDKRASLTADKGGE